MVTEEIQRTPANVAFGVIKWNKIFEGSNIVQEERNGIFLHTEVMERTTYSGKNVRFPRIPLSSSLSLITISQSQIMLKISRN
jgi:hypothetical protein